MNRTLAETNGWRRVLAVGLGLSIGLASFLAAEGSQKKFHAYQLSYIDVERAGALLCFLGYNVVRYTEAGVTTPGCKEDPKLADTPKGRIKVYELRDVGPMGPIYSTNAIAALGGNPLPEVSTAVPVQRLMLVWEEAVRADADTIAVRTEVQKLLVLLHDEIDVPAKQILIEAMVIELDRDRLTDLGFGYDASKDGQKAKFGLNKQDDGTFTFLPFTVEFTRPSAKSLLEFTGQLSALLDKGEATILSRPSVLVLDGRQARIRIGNLVPYVETLTTEFGTSRTATTNYIDVGITLNLRPRVSSDGSDVTMQVETVVSDPSTGGGAGLGPPVAAREVQTIVRVANDTPFVIGGLISTSRSKRISGIPGLSKIPGIGHLFRRTVRTRDNKEVVVLITPHVIPPEERAFSLTVARDSDLFNQSGLELFRNIYRVRNDDILDLGFIRQSAFYQNIERVAKKQARDAANLLAYGGRDLVAPGDTAGLVKAIRDWAEEDPESLLQPIIAELYLRVLGDSLELEGQEKARAIGAIALTARDRVKARPAATKCLTEAIANQLRRAEKARVDGTGFQVSKETAQAHLKRLIAVVRGPALPKCEGGSTEPLCQLQTNLAKSEPLALLKLLKKALDIAQVDASAITDQFIRLLDGKIPGESILVKRMLLEIVEKRELGGLVDRQKIIFYEESLQQILDPERLTERLREVGPLKSSCNTIGVLFGTSQTSAKLRFDPPTAKLEEIDEIPEIEDEEEEYLCRLRRKNCLSADGSRWEESAILLNDCYEPSRGRSTLDRLASVLVLKRLLDLNPTLPLTLEGFHPGLEIVLPTEEDLRKRNHLVDREAAELYFETVDYYYAFELAIRQSLNSIKRLGLQAPPHANVEQKLDQLTRAELNPYCSCSPIARFEASSAGLSARFEDKSEGDPVSWKWDFGDKRRSTLKEPEHTYQKAGEYLVMLEIATGDDRTDTTCEPLTVLEPATSTTSFDGRTRRPETRTPTLAQGDPMGIRIEIVVDYSGPAPSPRIGPPRAATVAAALADAILVPLPARGTGTPASLPDGPR